jgi:16S rRNA (cytosine967-C5)-methyltransferase
VGQELRKATGFNQDNVRGLAAAILLKVETRKAYADVLLDHTLKTTSLSPRDRALLTELLYGTLRWRGRIDAELQPYIRRSLPDPLIKNLLRLALYQLLFLDRIPEYASVNDAVELAKARGGDKVGGFVNGVLRSFLREHRHLAKPSPKEASPAVLAAYWSHPEWLVSRWLEYFGTEEIQSLLQANNNEAPLVLRVNLMKVTRQELLDRLQNAGIEASFTAYSPQGVTVHVGGAVPELPGFPQGMFQIQSEASQLVGYLLAPQPGERILDACAAPGGKTTHLAELMNDHGEVIAADISEKSLEKMADSIVRLGLKSIRMLRVDLSEGLPESITRPYDRILIDAPCSGLGTVRSHPEIKWHRSQSDISRLTRLQQRILARTAFHLKPGGVLVYSTCTLSWEENENIVESFLSDHREFVLEAAAGYLPGPASEMVRDNYFLALPHRHNTDGFFAARMTRLAK